MDGRRCTRTLNLCTFVFLSASGLGVVAPSAGPVVHGGDTTTWPTGGWAATSPESAGMDPAKLAAARDYALTGGGSGMITRGGRLVMSWGNMSALYELKSSTKSIGVTALGLAMGDRLLDPSDPAGWYLSDIGIPPESRALLRVRSRALRAASRAWAA